MLKRVAEARRNCEIERERQGVLVKRPKPGQDLRVDLPAIGPNTVRNADAAGLAGIAVMAGHVLAAKRSEMIAIADRCGLFIAGIEEATQGAQPSSAALGSARPVGLGSVRIGDRADADIGRAIGYPVGAGGFRQRIGARDRRRSRHRHRRRRTAARRHRTSRRTSRKKTRREGVAAIGAAHAIDEAIVVAASDAKLVGVVKVGRSADLGI